MAGHLYITEYSQMGDVAAETPVEPPVRVQRIDIGGESEVMNADTRCVVLFATFPCMVSFSSDDHDSGRAWPLPSGMETLRMVRPNTRMSVHVFHEEVML